MNKSSQTKLFLLRIGFVLSSLFALVGVYWMIMVANSEFRGWDVYNELFLACISVIFIIIGIIGATISFIWLMIIPGGLSLHGSGLIILIPIGILMLAGAAYTIKPLFAIQMRFQASMGENNFRSIYIKRANLSGIQLIGADLTYANLPEADLSSALIEDANLTGAYLLGSNLNGTSFLGSDLTGAILDNEQIVFAYSMQNATMPDGSKYDGRFFLTGDISFLLFKEIDICDPLQMARFYNVDREDYLIGLEWASENLPKLRTIRSEDQADFLSGGPWGSPSNFTWVDLSNTDLRGAKLTGYNLSYADFTGADLSGAELANANLCGAKISEEQLTTVSTLKNAIMPDGRKYYGR